MAVHSDTNRDPAAPVKEEANRMWRDAKDAAQSAASGQQRAAAEGVGEFASALRQAADHVGADGQATTARIAQSVADGLDRLSGSLRNRDLNAMVRDVENFARAQPMVFFGAALATGFIAMRFLKSGEPTSREPTSDMHGEQRGQWPVTDPVTPYEPSAASGERPITTP